MPPGPAGGQASEGREHYTCQRRRECGALYVVLMYAGFAASRLTATTRSVPRPTSHPPRATEGVSLGAVPREQMVAAQGAALLSSFGVRRPLKYPESEPRGSQTAHVSATRPGTLSTPANCGCRSCRRPCLSHHITPAAPIRSLHSGSDCIAYELHPASRKGRPRLGR